MFVIGPDFVGQLDEVAIHDEALAPARILAHDRTTARPHDRTTKP